MKDIESALRDRLAAMPPPYPVAWPNVHFKGPAPFLEVQFALNETERLTQDARHRIPGIMQVTVVWKRGDNTLQANAVADAIAGQFPADLRIYIPGGHVRVTKRPTVAGALADDAGWRVPVRVSFEALI